MSTATLVLESTILQALESGPKTRGQLLNYHVSCDRATLMGALARMVAVGLIVEALPPINPVGNVSPTYSLARAAS